MNFIIDFDDDAINAIVKKAAAAVALDYNIDDEEFALDDDDKSVDLYELFTGIAA